MTVRLFDRFDVSTPAFVIFVSGLVVGIIILLISPHWWPAGLGAVFMSFVAAYNVNCSLVGNCKYWALFLTSMFLTFAIVISICLLVQSENHTLVGADTDSIGGPGDPGFGDKIVSMAKKASVSRAI